MAMQRREGVGGGRSRELGGKWEELEDLDHLLRHDWVVLSRFNHVLQIR